MNFSVVIPLYNKALHIERALRSVLAQTCQDFEIIVVNDGSTDNGGEIVEGIGDARIRLIDQLNQGVSVARNVGIEAARQRYIAFLDADDEWLPEYLWNIRVLINNFPDCGAYASAIKTVRPHGQMFFPKLDKLPPEPWIGILPNFFELFQDGLTAFHPSSIVLPKEVLQEVSGFPVGVVLFEDICCWVNVAIRYPIAFSPKRLTIYHQEAINRSNVHKNLSEVPFANIIQKAITNGLISPELQQEVLEFVAQWQIHIASVNIINGNSEYAKRLLSACRGTGKYKKLWYWWRFWSIFPPGLPGRFSAIKQKITG
jgi:glycosyltransferase involved in cell wall biosynthesis